jgi:predicted RNA binding protein YcfA (HicA-like mRNA interferase family)
MLSNRSSVVICSRPLPARSPEFISFLFQFCLLSWDKVKVREVVKLLEANGWRLERQKGSHAVYRNDGDIVVVPVHGGDLKPGALKSILRKTGLKQ